MSRPTSPAPDYMRSAAASPIPPMTKETLDAVESLASPKANRLGDNVSSVYAQRSTDMQLLVDRLRAAHHAFSARAQYLESTQASFAHRKGALLAEGRLRAEALKAEIDAFARSYEMEIEASERQFADHIDAELRTCQEQLIQFESARQAATELFASETKAKFIAQFPSVRDLVTKSIATPPPNALPPAVDFEAMSHQNNILDRLRIVCVAAAQSANELETEDGSRFVPSQVDQWRAERDLQAEMNAFRSTYLQRPHNVSATKASRSLLSQLSDTAKVHSETESVEAPTQSTSSDPDTERYRAFIRSSGTELSSRLRISRSGSQAVAEAAARAQAALAAQKTPEKVHSHDDVEQSLRLAAGPAKVDAALKMKSKGSAHLAPRSTEFPYLTMPRFPAAISPSMTMPSSLQSNSAQTQSFAQSTDSGEDSDQVVKHLTESHKALEQLWWWARSHPPNAPVPEHLLSAAQSLTGKTFSQPNQSSSISSTRSFASNAADSDVSVNQLSAQSQRVDQSVSPAPLLSNDIPNGQFMYAPVGPPILVYYPFHSSEHAVAPSATAAPEHTPGMSPPKSSQPAIEQHDKQPETRDAPVSTPAASRAEHSTANASTSSSPAVQRSLVSESTSTDDLDANPSVSQSRSTQVHLQPFNPAISHANPMQIQSFQPPVFSQQHNEQYREQSPFRSQSSQFMSQPSAMSHNSQSTLYAAPTPVNVREPTFAAFGAPAASPLSESKLSVNSNALLDDAHFQALLLGKLKYLSTIMDSSLHLVQFGDFREPPPVPVPADSPVHGMAPRAEARQASPGGLFYDVGHVSHELSGAPLSPSVFASPAPSRPQDNELPSARWLSTALSTNIAPQSHPAILSPLFQPEASLVTPTARVLARNEPAHSFFATPQTDYNQYR